MSASEQPPVLPCEQSHTRPCGLTLTCSHLALSSVPHGIPPTTCCLLLDHNAITTLHQADLPHLTRLVTLDLSYNRLTGIQGGAFQNLSRLKVLKLNNNRIVLTHKNFPSNVFDGMPNLEHLEMHHNLNDNMASYRDDVYRRLRRLIILVIDGLPKGIPFGDGYSRLRALRQLRLHGDFNFISNDTFTVVNSSRITHLYIQGGKLEDVEPMAFSHFTH